MFSAMKPAGENNSRKSTLILLCLIGLAATAVRVAGVGYGLPMKLIEDESFSVSQAVHIAQTGDLRPRTYTYPTFQIYTLAAAYKLLDWAAPAAKEYLGIEYDIYDTTPGYLVARFLTALMAALTVLVVFFVGRRLYGDTVGLVAAAFLAFSPLHVGYANTVTPNLPMAFWTTLSFLYTVKYWGGHSRRHFFLASFFAGIAFSTKYHCALIALPLALAWLMRTIEEKRFNFGFLYAGLFFAAGFVVFTPYVLIDFPAVVAAVRGIYGHYADAGHPGYTGSDNWLYYLKGFAGDGLLSLAASFAGMAILLRKFSRESVLVLSFPVVFFAVVSSFKVSFIRNLIPVLPFLALFAAVAVDAVSRWGASLLGKIRGVRPTVAVLLVLICVRYPATLSLKSAVRYTRTDTRLIAADWINKHLPPGAFLACEKYVPAFDSSRFLSCPVRYAYRHSPEYYREAGFDYLVLNSFAYQRFYDRSEENEEPIAGYDALWRSPELRLVREFQPDGLTPGPVIRIMEVKDTGRVHEGTGRLAPKSLRFDGGCAFSDQGEIAIGRGEWIGQKLILEPGAYFVEADVRADTGIGVSPVVTVVIDGESERLSLDSSSWKKTILGSLSVGEPGPHWFFVTCPKPRGLALPKHYRYRIVVRDIEIRKAHE
jgi:4-amino-4-deoxy-L-arabinose transferase-like glycosyltransferase